MKEEAAWRFTGWPIPHLRKGAVVSDHPAVPASRVKTNTAGTGLLAIVLLLTSIGGIAAGLWYPDYADGEQYTYAQDRPIRHA